VRVTEHWHRLPREDSHLRDIQKLSGHILGNWLYMVLLQQRDFHQLTPEVDSNLNLSVIL